MHYDCFHPGEEWLDTSGKPIQAHGGSVIYDHGHYYWYGENKEFTNGQNGVWHWGVRCYRSDDLYNWEDMGLIIPPQPDDPASPLHPSRCMDRPHIVYHAPTKKYVCYVKLMENNGDQTLTVLTADSLLGPYTIRRTGVQPLGMNAGDFDLAVDEQGRGYYFFERVHYETVIAELSEDLLDTTGVYSTHFPHAGPPDVREATAHFIRGGKHYLLTSGTTGYLPNPSEIAVADTWHGPYRILGNPHPGDSSRTSYHSQVSSVFRLPGKKDLYIALADRWAPDKMELQYEEYARAFAQLFDPAYTGEKRMDPKFGNDMERNTSIARYVWLPIRFDGEVPTIDWRDSWPLNEFENED